MGFMIVFALFQLGGSDEHEVLPGVMFHTFRGKAESTEARQSEEG
jgi:hypothetical protein